MIARWAWTRIRYFYNLTRLIYNVLHLDIDDSVSDEVEAISEGGVKNP